MDASTLASAALAIAVENSEPTAMQELLLERERLAMDREGLRSQLVERHYVQPPASVTRERPEITLWTWRDALEHQTAVLDERSDEVRYQAIVLRENLDNVMGDMEFMLSSPLTMVRNLRTGPAVERRTRRERSRSRLR